MTFTIQLFGLECHVCGLPASYFSNGVTTPCGCGSENSAGRQEILRQIHDYNANRRAVAAKAAQKRKCKLPETKDPIIEFIDTLVEMRKLVS